MRFWSYYEGACTGVLSFNGVLATLRDRNVNSTGYAVQVKNGQAIFMLTIQANQDVYNERPLKKTNRFQKSGHSIDIWVDHIN